MSYIPKWHKELQIFSKINPLIILEGNILDCYAYPGSESLPEGSIVRLTEYLHYYFKDAGYKSIVFYDSMSGFANPYEQEFAQSFAALVGASKTLPVRAQFRGCAVGTAANYVNTALSQTNEPAAIVMSFASRYISNPNQLD